MRKLLYISILVILSVLTSCQLDDNISPNLPSADGLSARKKLASAQTSSYSVQGSTMNRLGNVFMNAYAGNIYYFGNPLVKDFSLEIDNAFYSSIWSSTYLGVGKLQNIIDEPSELVYHKAIAKILKAHYMQYLVDLYNDIPYSEAFKLDKNINPKYDNSVDVYKALIGEINEAVRMIEDNPENDDIMVHSNEDIIMGGDMTRWINFANSVKLRYLVRMSKTTNSDAISFRDAQLQTLVGKSLVNQDVTINPGYNSSSSSSLNPTYSTYGVRKYDGGLNTYGWRLYKASKHIVDALNETGDVRKYGLFWNAPWGTSEFRGVEQGAIRDENSEWDFSCVGGWKMLMPKYGSTHDGILMSLSEIEFLQAEAAVVFPSAFSGAQEHFNAGIQASFNSMSAYTGWRYNVKETPLADYAADYMSSIDSEPGRGWSATTDKLECIQYQRWIALVDGNALETYMGYLKTGYPHTPLALTATKANKPYRLVYPLTEYSTNASQVPAMTTDQAFEINEFTPFWIK